MHHRALRFDGTVCRLLHKVDKYLCAHQGGFDVHLRDQLVFVDQQQSTDQAWIRNVQTCKGGGVFRVEEREVVVHSMLTQVVMEKRSRWKHLGGKWCFDLPMLRWKLWEAKDRSSSSMDDGVQETQAFCGMYAGEDIMQVFLIRFLNCLASVRT